jgi:hypothetical protein
MKNTHDENGGSRSVDHIVGHHFGCKEHDALWVALHAAAIEEIKPQGDYQVTDIVYEWLKEETRHGIVCAIMRELRRRGFHISPNVRDQGSAPSTNSAEERKQSNE